MIRILLSLLLLLAAVPSARAQDKPLAVTTDTREYCVHLGDLVAAHPNPTPEVRRLLTQGRSLCERGQVRGGIRRLRRAMVMLRHMPPKPVAKTETSPPPSFMGPMP